MTAIQMYESLFTFELLDKRQDTSQTWRRTGVGFREVRIPESLCWATSQYSWRNVLFTIVLEEIELTISLSALMNKDNTFSESHLAQRPLVSFVFIETL